MKKIFFIKNVLLASAFSITLSSCATIFGGPVSSCQTKKPSVGEDRRKIRVAPLVADIIICWPVVFVDFATGAIYKPCSSEKNNTPQTNEPVDAL